MKARFRWLVVLALILGVLRSKAWSMTLAAAGFVYGAIGVFTLGVTLDYGLLAGAAVLGLGAGGLGTRDHRQLPAAHLVPNR